MKNTLPLIILGVMATAIGGFMVLRVSAGIGVAFLLAGFALLLTGIGFQMQSKPKRGAPPDDETPSKN